MKIGIVGCGLVTDSHIKAWLKVKNIKIVAVCDLNEKRSKETANRWNIANSYSDISQMLEKENIDVVDICTPPRTHTELAIEAMNNGSHVLIEKPMAINLYEAEKIVTAQKNNNVKLCIVHNGLFNHTMQEALRMWRDGAIGDLIGIEAKFLFKADENIINSQNHWYHGLPGGMIGGEVAPHPVYLELAFLENVKSVHTTTFKFGMHPWIKADELRILLEGDNALGSIYISSNSCLNSNTITIFGTKMTLHIDMLTMNMVKFRSRDLNSPISLVLNNLDQSYQLVQQTLSVSLKAVLGRIRTGHDSIIQKFVESIQNDTEPPVTAEHGRDTLAILEKIWKQIE